MKRSSNILFSGLLTLCGGWLTLPALADDPPADINPGASGEEAHAAGHSYHGEAFNDGPRQAAYLMGDTGKISFRITSSSRMAKKFFLQGMGQLHGFWYFEAERSFRQCAALDEECAIAYWGMAQANIENEKRARGFLAEAIARQDSASKREQLYIASFAACLGMPTTREEVEKLGKLADYTPKGKIADRRKAYMRKLEDLILEYPDDIEAKALLLVTLWQNNRKGVPLTSTFAADALAQQIFDVNPMHQAHHYRIHIWDRRKAATALDSAADCGFTAPTIAHMWHMPGHIYSKEKRYADAAWHQEASARTDHRHMMEDRVLPDQIHNFAHNNEWLIRNLIHLGRIPEALDLAKNMTELPRHPTYNTFKKGSAKYGRLRLRSILTDCELWEEARELCEGPYLEPTEIKREQIHRLQLLGRACYAMSDLPAGDQVVQELSTLRAEIVEKQLADLAAKEAEAAAKKAEAAAKKEEEDATKAAETEKKKAEATVEKEEEDAAKAAEVTKKEAEAAAEAVEEDAPKENAVAEIENASGVVAPAEKDKVVEALEEEPSGSKKVAAESEEVKSKIGEEEPDAAKAVKAKPEEKTAPSKDEKKKTPRLPADATFADSVLRELKLAKDHATGRSKEALAEDGFKTSGINKDLLLSVYLAAGEHEKATELAAAEVKRRARQTIPLARHVHALHVAGRQEEAEAAFLQLRSISEDISLTVPVFERLSGFAATVGAPSDWRQKRAAPDDIRRRPKLTDLGPFRWQPSLAPSWTLPDHNGDPVSLEEQIRGQNVLLIFYLGAECLHCVEQLGAFGPKVEEYRKAGIKIIAVSLEDPSLLRASILDYGEGGIDALGKDNGRTFSTETVKIESTFPFPLLADPSQDLFKAYRAYDDFEDTALHGTFLIDRRGYVRWQDISYEPFTEPEFLLKECIRLLAQPDAVVHGPRPKPSKRFLFWNRADKG